MDNRGLAGVEKAAGEELRRRAAARQGPLALSLDIRIQHVLAEALAETMTAHRALGAAGMVMDVESGELLALVSLPAFDPKGPDRSTKEERFNRATLGTYELGSTFKPFTIAMALDQGIAGIEDSYDATRADQGLAPPHPRSSPRKPLADPARDPHPLLKYRGGEAGGGRGCGAPDNRSSTRSACSGGCRLRRRSAAGPSCPGAGPSTPR